MELYNQKAKLRVVGTEQKKKRNPPFVKKSQTTHIFFWLVRKTNKEGSGGENVLRESCTQRPHGRANVPAEENLKKKKRIVK